MFDPATSNSPNSPAKLNRLIKVFDEVLGGPYRTMICGGAKEPLYQPAACAQDFNKIYFTLDYFSSALHEIAHWCVAGESRRKLIDYGYWYQPDGRNSQQQAEFEKVEVSPQAMEWIFSRACGHVFRVSADNLEAKFGASQSFKNAIHQRVSFFCINGLPERAANFTQKLADEFKQPDPFKLADYRLEDI